MSPFNLEKKLGNFQRRLRAFCLNPKFEDIQKLYGTFRALSEEATSEGEVYIEALQKIMTEFRFIRESHLVMIIDQFELVIGGSITDLNREELEDLLETPYWCNGYFLQQIAHHLLWWGFDRSLSWFEQKHWLEIKIKEYQLSH